MTDEDWDLLIIEIAITVGVLFLVWLASLIFDFDLNWWTGIIS